MNHFRFVIVLLAVLALCSQAVLAHRVFLFAYADEGTVYTESYFPDKKAVEGCPIQVFDSHDVLLLEGKTDAGGKFSFLIPKKDDLRIVLLASPGHTAEFRLGKEDLE